VRLSKKNPAILATQEIEIVQSQSGEIVRETLSQKNPSPKKGSKGTATA
jgi:hypothetical protein